MHSAVRRWSALALWILLVCQFVGLGTAIHFSVEPGKQRCLTEYIVHDDILVVGKYSVEPMEGQDMEVKVTDPLGRPLFHRRRTEGGKFAFTSTMPGEHLICFTSTAFKMFGNRNRAPPAARGVMFELKMGVDAHDYSELALREHLTPLEKELKKANDRAYEVSVLLTNVRVRDSRHRDTSESTNARVMWYSVFTMFGFFTLNAWQILYLKRFFQQKKLI